ncbi:uncharacterized protein LOC110251219 [Exaiptasia diaphana]|uniref:Uncharacterized protein n=1 Tax=Exaiptasia diaphana TaxID=2652724 RepID=A0A913YT30_EXADI|nr:uncharacterized protein LOC110251219 [Exaiptasia diaphana]
MALLFHGESRWKIFKHHLFWIKICEIVFPLLIFPFCVTFKDHASLRTEDSVNWLNITVKYPFKYYENTTALYNGEDSPLKFSFDEAISACVQLFVIVTIVTMIQAIFMVLLSCVLHRRQSLGQAVMYTVS